MNKNKDIQIGLIGLGTVGTGVVTILREKESSLQSLTGSRLVLKKIADLDLERGRGLSLPPGVLTRKAEEILEDPEIEIVVELIGGYEPAKTFILKALAAGKHVVTANKALLAEAGNELFRAAQDYRRHIGFEASVCGGIPIILTLRQGLVANEIESLFGIMNGTSNFILSRMSDEGQPYPQALKEAQKLGYAEADPTLDVEGHDTAHKLAILMHLAYGLPMDVKAIHTEGITRITPQDIAFAREFGYRVKLLAICRKENGLVEARVHPTMIPKGHMLSNVSGAYNALFIHGDAVGDILLYGLGAGMMPTGSAVVSDLVDIGRNINQGITRRIPQSSVPPEERGSTVGRQTLRRDRDASLFSYFRPGPPGGPVQGFGDSGRASDQHRLGDPERPGPGGIGADRHDDPQRPGKSRAGGHRPDRSAPVHYRPDHDHPGGRFQPDIVNTNIEHR